MYEFIINFRILVRKPQKGTKMRLKIALETITGDISVTAISTIRLEKGRETNTLSPSNILNTESIAVKKATALNQKKKEVLLIREKPKIIAVLIIVRRRSILI